MYATLYLKNLSKNGELNEDVIYEILEEQKANQKEKLKIFKKMLDN